MEKKELAIGSNGDYFVDGFHVDEATFYQVKISQQLDEIQEMIRDIMVKLLNN